MEIIRNHISFIYYNFNVTKHFIYNALLGFVDFVVRFVLFPALTVTYYLIGYDFCLLFWPYLLLKKKKNISLCWNCLFRELFAQNILRTVQTFSLLLTLFFKMPFAPRNLIGNVTLLQGSFSIHLTLIYKSDFLICSFSSCYSYLSFC